MTTQEFLEAHNYTPYDFEEVARLLIEVDDEEISGPAKAFLETKENLEMTLDNIGFEFG